MLAHNPTFAKTKKWDPNAEIPAFYLVLPAAAAEDGKKHVDLYTHKGLLTRLEGVKALADWMGLPKSSLVSTLQNYRKAARKGTDEFGKTSFRGAPKEDLDKEVFYAGQVTPVLHYCMGGIKIDAQGNVLKEDGSIIPGLHAAGEVTGGVHGNNRLGGNSLLECTVYGTIVGQKIPIKAARQAVTMGLAVEKKEEKATELPIITKEELAKHNTANDLWVAVHGVVYDFTDFADEHPAGAKSIVDLAGTDGTAAFSAVHNQNMLDDFEDDIKGYFQSSSSGTAIVPPSGKGIIPPESAVSGSPQLSSSDERIVTRQELMIHNTPDDCWVAFHGTVYNMTVFSASHPGGAHLIREVAGSDGTEKFNGIHKKGKLRLVEHARIGTLQHG